MKNESIVDDPRDGSAAAAAATAVVDVDLLLFPTQREFSTTSWPSDEK